MSENENKTIPNDKIKSDKKPNVPNLRFSNFIESWKKKRFYEIADFYKGCGISKEQLTLEGNECILYGELYTTYDTETIDEVKSKTNIETKGLFFSKKNDVIIPASGETPIDIATACCVCKDNVLFGGDLNVIRLKYDNGSFISCQLNGKRKIDIAKIAQGASIVHLHNDDLKKLVLYIPTTLEEELKIVKLFTLIDSRIKTQSKIIEDLELLEKSISHKIFGDNSLIKKDWKLTKLSDVLIERKTYDVKESSYPHVTLSKDGIYSKSDRYNRDFLVKDEEKNYKITHLNDICYNPANLKFGVICLNTYGDAIFSPIYVTYEVKNGNDAYFISQYVTNSTFIGHIRKYEQGTVYERMAVSSEDFLKGKIYLPPINIQNEITQIFKLLDKKINIELEILNKLKEQKKYLLSNMFI